jgi:hypothetical protein
VNEVLWFHEAVLDESAVEHLGEEGSGVWAGEELGWDGGEQSRFEGRGRDLVRKGRERNLKGLVVRKRGGPEGRDAWRRGTAVGRKESSVNGGGLVDQGGGVGGRGGVMSSGGRFVDASA